MRIISRKSLYDAAARHSSITKKIEAWYNVAKAAKWNSLADVKRTYPSADGVGNFTVFNINDYRLIVGINYKAQIIYYKYLLTHSEYDRGTWKNDNFF